MKPSPSLLEFPAVAAPSGPADSAAEALHARVSAAYALAQSNPHVFASPLGPFRHHGRAVWLPRLVFFGPHASNDSWRLAFLGSLDHRDLRPAHAVLEVLTRLAGDRVSGHALNVTFFPVVDAAGLALRLPSRALAQEAWPGSRAPEIRLLERDARERGYHGFVRIETAPAGEDQMTVSVRGSERSAAGSLTADFLAADAASAPAVRFERVLLGAGAVTGPLSMVGDVAMPPFELTLRIPASWSDTDYNTATADVALRLLRSYRAFQAYGGQL